MEVHGNVRARFTVVSLFSGCGGMDLGFRGDFQVFGKTYYRQPFEIVWANDCNPAACETYRRNIGAEIVCDDIQNVFDSIPRQADIVLGGFPCQDISINGRRRGTAGDRSGLYKAMVRVVDQCRPRLFVAENVKGLTQDYQKESLREVVSDFAHLGYEISYRVYLAANYGVPQMRERVFIVGTAPDVCPFAPPPPVVNKQGWLTAEEAIRDLEGAAEDANINHIWSRAKPSPDQGRRRLKADRPSDTIRAEHHGNIQFHYRLPRRISMREAARIQSFPDDFVFQSGLRQIERQVGNAVPPVLAWHLASATLKSLQGRESERVSSPSQAHQLGLTTRESADEEGWILPNTL